MVEGWNTSNFRPRFWILRESPTRSKGQEGASACWRDSSSTSSSTGARTRSLPRRDRAEAGRSRAAPCSESCPLTPSPRDPAHLRNTSLTLPALAQVLSGCSDKTASEGLFVCKEDDTRAELR